MRQLGKWVMQFVALGAVLVASVQVAEAAPPPGDGGGGVGAQGIYALNSRVRIDPNQTVAWSIEWQVPRLENSQEAWGAIGQWMFSLETGIYYAPGDGWWVYYFGDNNGLDGNNPNCTPIWDNFGGACHAGGMGQLPVGRVVTFTHRRCTPYPGHVPDPAGSQLCVWVDLHDGQGERFLVEDNRETVEMYAHDVETFGDSNFPEPIVACDQPTVMRRQFIQTFSQPWQQLTGDQWDFEDGTERYRFANVDRAAGRWESCSDIGNDAVNQTATGSTPCSGGEGPWNAVNGSVTWGAGDKWCSLDASRWLQVDLGRVQDVNRLVLQHAGAGGEPAVWNTRAYTIRLSQNGSTWTTPVTVTANTANTTTHNITRTRARYVRVDVQTPTQTTDPAARIYELEVYNVGGNQALNRAASGSTPCTTSQGPAKAFNGSFSGGSNDKWCSSVASKWLQVDLGRNRGVQRLVVRHAGAGGEATSLNTRDFTISLSRDGVSWSIPVTVTGNTASTTTHTITTTQARYVRVDVQRPTQTTNPAARIYELEVTAL